MIFQLWDDDYRFHITNNVQYFTHHLMESDEDKESQDVLEGRWMKDEHDRFLAGIIAHGKDWKIVEKVVKTRTGSQVRSHAQKFFIKLNKISKERKKCKNYSLIQPSDIQREILDQFTEQDITSNTPTQISAVLKKDWTTVAATFKQKKKIPKASKLASRKSSKQQFEKNEDKEESNEPIDKDQRPTNQQDESYFIKVIKSNRQHFIKGHDFKELIDFGHMSMNQNEESQTNLAKGAERKQSFWLPDDENNEIKLKQTLQCLRRRMHGPEEGASA